jgi:hypothetical protein
LIDIVELLQAVPEQDEAAWGAFVQTFDLANKATEMERVRSTA